MSTIRSFAGSRMRLLRASLLVLLAAGLLGCGATEIASGLTEGEAQEAVVTLQQFGVSAEKVRVGEGEEATFSVTVPAAEVASANQILKKYELPREKPKGLGEIFTQGGLIPTATEEKAMMLLAIQGEIARTLETVDGIAAARVHIVMPEKDPLAEGGGTPASASVFIKYRGEQLPLTPEEIKQIVAHSVDGLDPNRVAVVLKPILIDQGKLTRMAKTSTVIAGQDPTIFIIVLAGLCLVLVIVMVVLVLKLQSEKSRYLQLRREMGAGGR